jgi:transposase
MVNKIPYNKHPDKIEFSELYETHTQRQLCKIYGCSEARIKKWILLFGLTLRPQGGGNNRKYQIDHETLSGLVSQGLTNDEISCQTGMSISNVNRYLKNFDIKRNYNTPEYKRYARRVRHLTESTYTKYKEVINPNGYPRTLCGVEGGYQLDHILSIRECFDAGLTIEDCAKFENLQMIPWEENLQKRKLKGYDL